MSSTCAACEHPLPCTSCPATHAVPDEAGVSDDFCDSVCQRAWHAAQNTDGYRPSDRDAAQVMAGAAADQQAQELTESGAAAAVHHGQRVEDLSAQLVDRIAENLANGFTAELWRGNRGTIRLEVACGRAECTDRVRYETDRPTDPDEAVTIARHVLALVRGHVTVAHGAPLANTDLERIPIWRVLGRWSEQGPVGNELRTMWTMTARGYPTRVRAGRDGDVMYVDAECDACARRGNRRGVTVALTGDELTYWLGSSGTRQAYLETVAYYLLGRITAHHDGHPRTHAPREVDTAPLIDTEALERASGDTAWHISNWAIERARIEATTPLDVARIGGPGGVA